MIGIGTKGPQTMKKSHACMAVLVLSLGPSLLAAGSTRKAVPGDPLDIAPFGLQETQATDAARIIRWPEPRKIRQVLVEFECRGPTP
jgi:hypothetical protein